MAPARKPGILRGDQPAGETAEDKGNRYRQVDYRPGPVGKSAAGNGVKPSRSKVQMVMDGLAEELLIIEENEFRKMAVSWGANAAMPITDTLTGLYPAMKKLGLTGKAYIKVTNGKEYVIIKGKTGVRKLLPGSRYAATNVRVADLVIGAKQLGHSALKSGALSLVFVAASDVFQYTVMDDKDFLSRELGLTLLANLSKASLATLIGTIASLAVSAASIPVVVPIAAGILVGVAVGVTLDQHYPTDKLVEAMENSYQENVVQPMYQMWREMLWRSWPHSQVPFPY